MPTALVTGASRGIGRACALRFAREGHDVVVNYNGSEAEAAALTGEITAMGVRALSVRADVSDRARVDAMAAAVREDFTPLDSLVINAGIYIRSSFGDAGTDAWDHTLAVNLDGAWHCADALIPLMDGSSGPTVVFVTSQLARRGSTQGAAYAASKGGMESLMKSLAQELAPRIRVNALAPGMIDTDILSGDSPRKRKEREAQVPLGRIGSPEEMAAAVWFLSCGESSYMTGSVLHANGGILMP